ncbi:MAG TPA: alkane 1-monooxygenase [Gammaproteobacteria bacterium]|nr:alkane 1-monooxygenase [Gammaproteobacteria bacterium]
METAARAERPTGYRDPKRYLWLWSLAVPALPLMGGLLAWLTGSGLWQWWTPLVFYVAVPLLDVLRGEDRHNLPESAVPTLESDPYYRRAVYAFLPVQFLGFFGGAWIVGTGQLPLWQALGVAVSVGLVNGVGINTAHELGHKKTRLERWLAKVALAPVAYGHFYVEHNRGHHVRVATPADPASARYGESFYRFWPRTVAGSWRSAWELERRRLSRGGHGVWSPRNDILQALAMTVLLYAAVIALFGPLTVPFLLIQAVIGFSELEVVNYLEHYGLARRRLDSGRYERVSPEHSWNSNHIVTNIVLYHLQRHSDHHANPTRRYQALRHYDVSPQLPAGYAAMILLALIPPLWRRVMDKRVRAHYGGDLDRANLDPRLRPHVAAGERSTA